MSVRMIKVTSNILERRDTLIKILTYKINLIMENFAVIEKKTSSSTVNFPIFFRLQNYL